MLVKQFSNNTSSEKTQKKSCFTPIIIFHKKVFKKSLSGFFDHKKISKTGLLVLLPANSRVNSVIPAACPRCPWSRSSWPPCRSRWTRWSSPARPSQWTSLSAASASPASRQRRCNRLLLVEFYINFFLLV